MTTSRARIQFLFLIVILISIADYSFPADVHSYSRPDDAVVRHIDLDLRVDFETRILSGKATLTIENLKKVNRLYLDSRDLKIETVTLGENGTETAFELGDSVPNMGRPLAIDIHPDTTRVNIVYSTSPGAAALQWLTPAQTSDRKTPFLYSQCQAILARTWVPCQDTPGVRFTYSATLRVPPNLLALMSATNPTQKNADGIYHFRMNQPIPSYLLAIAVGDLQFRSLGKHTGIYSEPPLIEKAAWEFADAEKMMEVAESMYGPYRWDRYDILILPPSFPYGGMENPRITFANPIFLAGDRSMVGLIAHELAHSWSGNLVTNATWNDFWINEGFTTYFGRRITEALYGKDHYDQTVFLGLLDLKRDIQRLGENNPDTQLKMNLKGRNPDEAATQIPYEKGYFFLRTIEETVGREQLDRFLHRYFTTFAFQSMDSERFLAYLRKNLLSDPELEKKISPEAWTFQPGIPDSMAPIPTNVFDRVDRIREDLANGAVPSKDETKDWTIYEKLYFIRTLPKNLSRETLDQVDAVFGFSDTGNTLLKNEWCRYVVTVRYEPAYPTVKRFLTGMGRLKYLQPIYTELAKTPEGLKFARDIYRSARPTYHAVAVEALDPILNAGPEKSLR